MTAVPGTPYNELFDLELDELSMVDFPAQGLALAAITKRKPVVEIGKTADPKQDHQETTMTDAEKKALEDKLAETQKALAKAEALTAEAVKERLAVVGCVDASLDLSDEHRSFAKGLRGPERHEFLAKSAADREAFVVAKRGREVYVTKFGRKFYESDNQEVVELWKRDEKREEELEKIRGASQVEVHKAKAIATLGNVGGKIDGKVALVKAVAGEKLTDDERKAADATIAQINSQCSMAFTRKSRDGGPNILDEDSPDKLLEDKADEIAKRFIAKGMSYDQALLKAQETQEYQTYADSLDAFGNQ